MIGILSMKGAFAAWRGSEPPDSWDNLARERRARDAAERIAAIKHDKRSWPRSVRRMRKWAKP